MYCIGVTLFHKLELYVYIYCIYLSDICGFSPQTKILGPSLDLMSLSVK